jgi:hypothetical protein
VANDAVELAEGGESGGAHPDNKVLVGDVKVGERADIDDGGGVDAVDDRAGRHGELVGLVGGPGDVVLGHIDAGVDKLKDVGEHGLGDETAGEEDGALRLVGVVVGGDDRIAVALEGIKGQNVAMQLRVVAGFDVAAMVLVVVGEAVVEEDGRGEIFGKRKSDVAFARKSATGIILKNKFFCLHK